MELFSLHSPPVTALLPSYSVGKTSFLFPHHVTILKSKRCSDARNLKLLDFSARTSGPVCATIGSISETMEFVKQEMQPKDENLAFVAGATGRVGSRTVRELLKLGFRVRAGVRNAEKAQTLLQSIQQVKLDDGAASASRTQFVEKLEVVECDLERDAIGPAIGNSSIVICCIGASEKEVFDITGPYRIDYQATKKLIDAATVSKVNHFILLTSLGTNKIGFPASILNLFWGVLIWKRKAEETLIASGLPYTIVRPGGMERPTDSYKETHNLVLANEDTYFGGQVSNLQVAELMAFMAHNRTLSFCKIVEVIAETTAPLTPMGELLSKIPSQRMYTSTLKEDGNPDDTPSKSVLSKSATTTEKEQILIEVQKARPLSPYVAYEDLKPPTSPTPTPSSTSGGTKESHVNKEQVESKYNPKISQINISEPASSIEKELKQNEVPKPRPLSPYFVYQDFKPPSSPTPTPSSSVGPKEVNAAFTSASNDVPQVPTFSRPLSPYHAYSDFKPPTSPSPSAPTVFVSKPIKKNLQTSSVAGTITSQIPSTDKSVNKEHLDQQKKQPLSPFTMYEDLKPPSSPTPSLRSKH